MEIDPEEVSGEMILSVHQQDEGVALQFYEKELEVSYILSAIYGLASVCLNQLPDSQQYDFLEEAKKIIDSLQNGDDEI